MFRLSLSALAAGAFLLQTPLQAFEGMWMPQQIPVLAEELKAQGLELDPEQLTDLLGDPMSAIVSLGGCSAAFVSNQGLIATNHHCVYGSIQFNSTPERDLIKNGFLAKTLADEVPTAPGSDVFVTSAIRDVTAEMLGALEVGKKDKALTDLEISRRIERKRRELLDACEKGGGVRCVLGSFFEGSQYLLITQLEIKDVRLVYAPAEGIGNYGGEIDNWMWPRHTGDFAFLRAYVGKDGKPAPPSKDNVPYRPRHILKVATTGVEEGDLVLIAGYPGRTFRYFTTAEVEQARQFDMPRFISVARDLIAVLERENQRGKEVELANYSRIRSLANRMKKFEGVLEGMRGSVGATDPVEQHRRHREQALARRDPAAAALLAEIAKFSEAKSATRERDLVLTLIGRTSPLLDQAANLYRMSLERPKADLDRADGFRERDWPRFGQGLVRTQRSIELGSDRAGLRFGLLLAAALPADQRIAAFDAAFKATGAGESAAQIEAVLDALYAGTKMADLAERQKMAQETTAQLEARGDTFLKLAASLWPEQKAREERDEAVTGAMLRLRPKYLEALKKLQGGKLYPDANNTLRVTFGEVTGYQPRDGVAYSAHTTFDGVLAKVTGEVPFDAPAALVKVDPGALPSAYLSPKLDRLPVNFLSTTDITGGNSGSAVMNGRGELVGLAFDGNWEGVVSDYLFLDERTRTISVDARYMRFVMDVVDGAHHLLEEMGLPVYAKPRN